MKSGLPALLDVRIYYNARYRDHYHRGGTLWDWVYQGEFRASVLFRASVGGAGAHVGGSVLWWLCLAGESFWGVVINLRLRHGRKR